jgi:DNA-binding CsgD family transcriptional regulator
MCHQTGASHDSELSPREREVVKLIAEGLSSKQIGVRLGISPKTVNFHRSHIKQRLNLRGTAGIVRYAIRQGIIEP